MSEAHMPISARLDLIGHSEEGRPISVLQLGGEDAPRRVLIVAGQHGDEPGAREAVAEFARRAARHGPRHERAALAIITNLNPDGAARASRANARGIDLNRDHLALQSAEVQVLHRFVRAWKPHLIVDVHNYPMRRKHLLARGIVYCHDVFLDIPTNPAIPPFLRVLWEDRLLQPMLDELSALDYECARYTLIRRSGLVRHSTLDIVDARNGLALRYGVPCVLVEGRTCSPHERPAERLRTQHGLIAALERAVARVELDPCRIVAPPLPPLPGEPVAVRGRLARSEAPFAMSFRNSQTSSIEEHDLSAAYKARVEVTRHAALPRAYAVPQHNRRLLGLLERQEFPHHSPDGSPTTRVECDQIVAVEPPTRPNRPPRYEANPKIVEARTLTDHVLFPTQHEGGRSLAVLLEAASSYGLARFESMELKPASDQLWPVLRVV